MLRLSINKNWEVARIEDDGGDTATFVGNIIEEQACCRYHYVQRRHTMCVCLCVCVSEREKKRVYIYIYTLYML